MMRRLTVPACCALLLLAGCRQPDDQRTDSISADQVREAREALPPGAVAQLDSGNAAYRARDYDAALRYYQAATREEPRAAAAWFGVYMAHTALGNDAAADSAMRRAQELQPGASLIHPDPGALPEGHP
jgi:tetratricopeptide (TPR) repeat protein